MKQQRKDGDIYAPEIKMEEEKEVMEEEKGGIEEDKKLMKEEDKVIEPEEEEIDLDKLISSNENSFNDEDYLDQERLAELLNYEIFCDDEVKININLSK